MGRGLTLYWRVGGGKREKFRKILYIPSWQRTANPRRINWRPLPRPMLPTTLFFKFWPTLPPTYLSPPNPTPTVLSVALFLSLNGLSCHISCANLRNDNMVLHISTLGTLVAEGPWYVFFATRHQVYWGLAQCVLLVIWFNITHTKHTQQTQGPIDWHTYIKLYLK